ncbi:MAG: ROK family protein [Alphaproteobacteria bacterium]|nr:ROK family protein [Alphaproteobacteria bacterium]
MKKILSFDVGGTKIAYAVVDELGQFVGEVNKTPTPKSAEEIRLFFQNTIRQYYDKIDGVAFSTAGAVNAEGTRIISFTGNLPVGYNQTDFLSLTDKPVVVENDANSAGWAEYALGAAQGCQNAVILTIGTGVGAGIIVNGRLLKGKSGAAGEMHFPIDSGHKRRCQGCGMWDCFESFASGTGLGKFAAEILGDGATGYNVISGKQQGEPKCEQAFNLWQDYLIKGIITLGNIFDPEAVVLSGSLGALVEYAKVEAAVNADILTPALKLYPARFANDAGLIGAALLACKKLSETV